MTGTLFFITLFTSILLDLSIIRNIFRWKKAKKVLEKENIFKKTCAVTLTIMILNIFMSIVINKFGGSPMVLNIYVLIHIIAIILAVIFIYITEDIIPTLNYLEFINKYKKEHKESIIGELKKAEKDKNKPTIKEDEMLKKREELTRRKNKD